MTVVHPVEIAARLPDQPNAAEPETHIALCDAIAHQDLASDEMGERSPTNLR
jgi:hypothetical protein